MKTRTAVLVLFDLVTLAVLVTLPAFAGAPADRSLQAGQFSTPTPGPDGKIIYIVQLDDTLWVIAARAGLTVEQLRALNGIQANDIITPGMKLILGLGGPAQPTQAAGGPPSPTPPPPTATPAFGTGELCALLFDDVNGNSRLDVGEPPLAGGRVSIADATGKVAAEFTTKAELDANGDPQSQCVPDLPSGDYNVSARGSSGIQPNDLDECPGTPGPGGHALRRVRRAGELGHRQRGRREPVDRPRTTRAGPVGGGRRPGILCLPHRPPVIPFLALAIESLIVWVMASAKPQPTPVRFLRLASRPAASSEVWSVPAEQVLQRA